MTVYFQSFADFIEMGGHGFFVWTSYAVTLIGLLGYYIYSSRLTASNEKELQKFYRKLADREQRLANNNQPESENEVKD